MHINLLMVTVGAVFVCIGALIFEYRLETRPPKLWWLLSPGAPQFTYGQGAALVGVGIMGCSAMLAVSGLLGAHPL